MARYSILFAKRGAFSFTSDRVIELAAAAKRFASDTSTYFHFKQGESIRSEDVSELMNDLYVKAKYISRIQIEGFGYQEKRHISLTIRPDRPPVECSIQGDREPTEIARNEIDTLIEASRLPYSWMNLPKNMAFELAAVIVTFIALMVFLAFVGSLLLSDKSLVPTVAMWSAVVLTPAVFIAKGWLFPVVVFNFGKSAERGERAKHWRNIVFVSILLSLIVGLIGAFLRSGFFGEHLWIRTPLA